MQLEPVSQRKMPAAEAITDSKHSTKEIPWIPIIAAVSAFFVTFIVVIVVFIVLSRKGNTVFKQQTNDSAMQQQEYNQGMHPEKNTGTRIGGDNESGALSRRIEYDEGSQFLKDLQVLSWIRSMRDYYTEGLSFISVRCDEDAFSVSAYTSIDADFVLGWSNYEEELSILMHRYDSSLGDHYEEFEGSLKAYLKKIRSDEPGWGWEADHYRPALVQASKKNKIKLYELSFDDSDYKVNHKYKIRYGLDVIDLASNELILTGSVNLQVDPDINAFADIYEEVQRIIRRYIQDDSIELPQLKDFR